jgi:Patatin-like phospholipase
MWAIPTALSRNSTASCWSITPSATAARSSGRRDTDPRRISFTRSLRVARRQVHDQAEFSPGSLASAVKGTLAELLQRLLMPRRHRSNPRVIKRKVSAGPSTRPPLRNRRANRSGLHHRRGHQAQESETDTDVPRTASLSEAVVASCSIPGWHQPALIDGRRYVDGAVASATSLDLIAQTDIDEVVVLAPMCSYQTDRPRNPTARAERLLRHFYTVQLTREAAKVRSTGINVTLLTPGPEDLAAIGSNLMDPSRREQVLDVSRQTTPRQIAALAHEDAS